MGRNRKLNTMKLTELILALFEESEFTNPSSLANHTGQTQPFVSSFLKGDKEARKKEDIIFDELSKEITVEQLLAAIDLIQKVTAAKIKKEQFL